MNWFQKISLTSCGLIATLVWNPSSFLVKNATENNKYFNFTNNKKNDKEINFAKKYLQLTEEKQEKEKYKNKITYEQGQNHFEKGLLSRVWVTKEFLGNVATTLGVSSAAIALIFAISIAVIIMKVGATSGGPIGAIIGAAIGALYAIATATIMIKVNSWKIGGCFSFDWTGIGTPITAMATLREQTTFETRLRVVPVHKDIKKPNKESYDFDYINKKQAKIWADFDYKNEKNFDGVIDISRYIAELKFRKIKEIKFQLFVENNDKKIIKIEDNKLRLFIKDYFLKSQKNDYLFITLKNNKFEIGGEEYEKSKKSNSHWIQREIKVDKQINYIGAYIQIQFEGL